MDLDNELRLEEGGYMEEDHEDDYNMSNLSGGVFGLDDDYINDFGLVKNNNNTQDNLNKSNLNVSTEIQTLNVKEELEAILFPKSQLHVNPNKTFFIKTIILDDDMEVIDENLLVIILNFLYNELHNGLIELGDQFLEERRKCFQNDFDHYLKIVELYIKSKEEFFMGVLSQIMSKLSISQTLLDSSFYYYINKAEETEKVIEIKITYDKVYRAGEKYSIAPKIITKLRLKNILLFQLETYQSLLDNYIGLSNDVYEIIVTDTVYSEYGFDKEAIRAAIQKHEIYNDKSFDEIINKLEDYRNSSFLN
jgi:hypothetical protein